jgi:hypothetical protein
MKILRRGTENYGYAPSVMTSILDAILLYEDTEKYIRGRATILEKYFL